MREALLAQIYYQLDRKEESLAMLSWRLMMLKPRFIAQRALVVTATGSLLRKE